VFRLFQERTAAYATCLPLWTGFLGVFLLYEVVVDLCHGNGRVACHPFNISVCTVSPYTSITFVGASSYRGWLFSGDDRSPVDFPAGRQVSGRQSVLALLSDEWGQDGSYLGSGRRPGREEEPDAAVEDLRLEVAVVGTERDLLSGGADDVELFLRTISGDFHAPTEIVSFA